MGKSSEPQTTTQSNKVELSPEQQQIFSLAFPYAKSYAEQPATAYTGKTLADQTAPTIAGQQTTLAAVPQVNQLAGQAATTNQFLMDPKLLDPSTNPWLKAQGDAITTTTTNNLNDHILPGLRAADTQAGGVFSGGSTKAGVAEGLAVGRTNQDITSALASLYGDSYKAGLSTMGQAVTTNPNVQMQQLFGADVQSAVGAQQEARQQAELSDAYAKWQMSQMMPFFKASDLMSMLSGMPGATSTSTVQGSIPRANPFMSGLGGAATGATLGSVIPGIGTGLGAGLGAIGGYLLR